MIELQIILCALLIAEAWWYDYLREYNERMHNNVGFR